MLPDARPQIVINANYELFALAMAVLQVVNSVLWLALRQQREGKVVLLISAFICLYFLADCLYRTVRFRDRRRFMAPLHGWLLWLGSLPAPFLAILRLIWFRLAIHTLRRGDYATIVDVVVEKRAQSTLLAILLAATVVLETAAVLILGAESRSTEANILTASDAVWWTIVTTATVGYGDRYPVTNAGRVIGVFVMIVGVALFGVLTSYLAQWFMRSRRATEATTVAAAVNATYDADLLDRFDQLSAQLQQQGTMQQADADDLRARLSAMEAILKTLEESRRQPEA